MQLDAPSSIIFALLAAGLNVAEAGGPSSAGKLETLKLFHYVDQKETVTSQFARFRSDFVFCKSHLQIDDTSARSVFP
jgi:hypothetical protein